MLKSVVDLQTYASIFPVTSIAQKWTGFRARLNAGCGLMDQFAFGFVGQFAVARPQLDLCVTFAAPDRTVTTTSRGGKWFGRASELN